jgi:hypothetical protein
MIDIYGADRASWPNARATDPGWAQDPEAREELRELNRQDREHEAMLTDEQGMTLAEYRRYAAQQEREHAAREALYASPEYQQACQARINAAMSARVERGTAAAMSEFAARSLGITEPMTGWKVCDILPDLQTIATAQGLGSLKSSMVIRFGERYIAVAQNYRHTPGPQHVALDITDRMQD